MLFNNFDYSATNALFVLPLLVVMLIAPFAPGSVLAGRLGRRAAVISLSAFLAYLGAVLALVFLPLPADPAAYCATAAGREGFSSVPFRWVGGIPGFMENQGQRLTLQGFLHNETIYQAITNIGLFLPLGVGLRLILGLRFPAAFAIALAFTLAIEVVQGTGLLGLLPCAHRLGDIDDVMLNVLGGAIGWIAAGYLRPTSSVRPGHRLVAFAIDLAIVEAVLIVINAAAGPFRPAPFAVAFVLTATALVVVPAAVNRGVTPGKAMTGIRLVARSGAALPPGRLAARYAVLFGLPAALFLWPQLMLPPETNDVTPEKAVIFGVELVVILLLGPVLMMLRRDGRGLHDIVGGSDHRPIESSASAAAPPAVAAA